MYSSSGSSARKRTSSPPPRGIVPLSRSRTSATLGPTSSSSRYMSKSPFVDGDLYSPSSRTSSTLPRTSSSSSTSRHRSDFTDDLPLHLSSRLNDSSNYLRSSGVGSSYRPSSSSGHYEPKSDYAISRGHGHGHGLGHSSSSSTVTSTLDPYVKEFDSVYNRSLTPSPSFRDTYRSTSERDVLGIRRTPSPSTHTSTYNTRSPIPGYRPSTEFKSSYSHQTPSLASSTHLASNHYVAPSSSSTHLGMSSSSARSSPAPPTEEYKSLASRVFSDNYKPDNKILDLDMDAKRLIAESEKTNRHLGLTVNSSVKMLSDMDEKLNEIEIRRKRRSKTPEIASLDLSVGLDANSASGRKSPSTRLSSDYKNKIDAESRSRERTPILASDTNSASKRDAKYDENQNIILNKTPNDVRDAKYAKDVNKDAQRKESVFEVEVNDERQVLDAVSSKRGDAKRDANVSVSKDATQVSVSKDAKNVESKCEKKETHASVMGARKNSDEQGIESRLGNANNENNLTNSVNNQETESKINCFNISNLLDGPSVTSFDESRRFSMSKKDQTPPAKYNYSFVALVAIVALVIIVVAVNK